MNYEFQLQLTRLMNYVVQIELERENGMPLCFKEDGGRFIEPQTLKMCVDTSYRIRVLCKEQLEMVTMLVNRMTVFLFPRNSARDYKVFEGIFKSEGIPVTRKIQRDIFSVHLPLDDETMLGVALQCKYYKRTSQNGCSGGTPLKNIIVNYRVEEDETVKVTGLKYRKIAPRW